MKNWVLNSAYDFRGQKVRYDIRGQGDPIVLVHGAPWSSFSYRYLIDTLSRRWKVHYYDLAGYGQSDKNADSDVSMKAQMILLGELFDVWRLKQPVVVGTGLGATILLRSALIDGLRYRKQVLCNPIGVDTLVSSFLSLLREYRGSFGEISHHSHKALLSSFVLGAVKRPMPPEVLDNVLSPWLGPTGQAAFYRLALQWSQAIDEKMLADCNFDRVECKTMILSAVESMRVPLIHGQTLHGMIAGSRFHTVDDAGHHMLEDQPEQISRLISGFIS